jgi:outer membrane protein
VNRGLVLPWFVYRGEFLRADRNSLGVRAYKSRDLELDIGVSGAFGSSADDIEARRGMPDLGTLVEFGPRLTWKLGEAAGGRWRVELPLRGVFDVSDGGANRGLSFEPELQFNRATAGGWRYSASVSAIFANQKLADTFYGVAPQYATATRRAYAADSGLVAWRLSTTVSRAHRARLAAVRLCAPAERERRRANSDSPLVRKTTGGSVGVALAWTWKQSDQRAVD